MSNANANKVVMVLEKSNFSLIKENDGGDNRCRLKGIFTQFGIKNNNGRIYEEKEFMPHLESLQKKIQRGKLLGELDHPDKFETSLNKASHVIEEISYDKNNRQLVGKIRLLNTDAGKNAQALVDDGIELSISSRAAGVVREDGTVQIKKVFTYDIVSDPGFECANLEKINESLGFSNSDNKLAIYDMHMTESELDNNIDNNIDDFASVNNNKKINNTLLNKYKSVIENNEKNMSNYLTIEDFQEYTLYLNEELNKLTNAIDVRDEIIGILENKLDAHEAYFNHMVGEMNNYIGYSVTAVNELESLIDYVNYTSNENNKLIEHSDYVVSVLNQIKDYSNYQTEVTNSLVEYIDYLSENLDLSLEESKNLRLYSNYLSEVLDRGLQFSDMLGENIGSLINYSEYIGENVGEFVNNFVQFTDYLGEKLNTSINYQNYISEELNKKDGVIDSGSYFGINEHRNNTQILIDNAKNVENRLNLLLESAEKQKLEENKVNSDGLYFKLLSDEKRREFLLLEDRQKQKVMEAIKQRKPVTEGEFVKIWEFVVNGPSFDDHVEILLENMPTEYHLIWDNLSENDKNVVISQSRYINIKNPIAVKDFWQTRAILNEKIEFQALNESQQIEETERNLKLGYTANYMNAIEKALDRQFKASR